MSDTLVESAVPEIHTWYKLPSYKLPSGVEEKARLDRQHEVFCTLLGGLYRKDAEGAVASALAPRSANMGRPAVLDVGSGTGIWTASMARKFPFADCLGIDPSGTKPMDLPNLRFKEGDVTKFLDDYEGQFDIIHCRVLLAHVPDPALLMKKMARCLRSGGVILFIDKGEGERVVEDHPVKCWTLRWMSDAVGSFVENQYAGKDLKALIQAEEGLQLKAFDNHWLNANWVDPRDPNGPEMRQLLKNISYFQEAFEACVPVLRKIGWSEEMLETARQKTAEEIETGYPKFSCTVTSAWATKA